MTSESPTPNNVYPLPAAADSKVASFSDYGLEFRFEPPVPVGGHVVESLGKLAALAARGPQSHPIYIDTMTNYTDRMLDILYAAGKTRVMAEYLRVAVAESRIPYIVTVEQ